MLIMTKAPIIEEMSSANGKKKRKKRSGKFGKNLKQGYSRLRDAGGVSVIENLLGVGALDPNLASETPVGGGASQELNLPLTDEKLNDKPKTPMTKTTKIVLWSVGILAVAGLSYYFYTKSKGKVSSAKIKA